MSKQMNKVIYFLLDDEAHKVGLNIPKRDPYFKKWDESKFC